MYAIQIRAKITDLAPENAMAIHVHVLPVIKERIVK